MTPKSILTTAPRDKLKTVSTATLCTALFKRGLYNQFIQDMHPLNPGLPNTVGEAVTLRHIPAREDLNPIMVSQDHKHPQRVSVEQCPPGAVVIPVDLVNELADEAVEMTAFRTSSPKKS